MGAMNQAHRINEAHVVTLTATVTTMKIGGRQVTSTTFKQLDEVPWRELRPMARVAPSVANHVKGWAIGSDAEGNLVRARFAYSRKKLGRKVPQVLYGHTYDEKTVYSDEEKTLMRDEDATYANLPLVVLGSF